MWLHGYLELNWTKKTIRNYKSGFALTICFQLEKDCDLVPSKWDYRQCGKDKLFRCTEHWSNYSGKKYASRNETSLNDYRYRYFTKAMTKNKVVNLNTLPLTSIAAQQHLFRVYYHVQTWLGNKLIPRNVVGNMTDNF
ncbi:hypothetical protein AVEN_166114-1 [Araneus ventricosus]|uniref:Uncharacterized protein n=1 Tax=Araneus ventricosus TaxID=182803 RepID=A0A4Y2SUW6_ARAVE|nr:hypothetical protein AVEN_67768-1 [Araneus ventricosus]GBN92027.1 hypothetical protein AVEN_166114-1 [Araneus ventricosus]